ncbi:MULTISPECIES: type IV pilus inner membrane component PilO [Acidithiobacillus]|jgi:type IV pilus assembly protein PilO|uniref:Fimbrial assembly protein PilO, putative n=2 Tax=root TaxID=1 RepID=B7J633_ACIF2|nr:MULTISPECIES: type 4a pilus biogenesis protein PilO [Acidithiobacillus]ACH83135.1 Pilus assembly protein PilO [Acidithiobacillus ferrooxidans ATCC 53993]ACK78806.1 fimbrial assembly protein PilO, putative [Acidithiobacillus ferrooxidans ATCC 23270]MBN6745649.1 type 4a pilus biogenesis protein PilO [Acidithiobacillus sp. MC2.2]MBN6748556.1 type 4a pilus biogenesis protein PilO [Acidithiobacillus sp. PG05]MBU2775270.1 type 4a pilus biogenesis protein PilO [Acidithiobacillus ferrooxidans]
MTFDELRNLQIDDIVRWPAKTKLVAIVIIVLIFGILAWFEFISPENNQYNQLKTQEDSLKTQVRQKQLLAASLPAYQAQIKEMNRRFQDFLQQLPNRTQIPSLLDDVTLAGRSRGLDFELFQPTSEVNKNFYAKIPVRLKVVGTYNDIGRFAAAVAAMPRIVTINDIDIARMPDVGTTSLAKAQASQKLVMQCTATTYRYLDNRDNAGGRGKNGGKS